MSGPGFPNVVSNTLHKLSATWNGLPGGTKLLRPCLSWGPASPGSSSDHTILTLSRGLSGSRPLVLWTVSFLFADISETQEWPHGPDLLLKPTMPGPWLVCKDQHPHIPMRVDKAGLLPCEGWTQKSAGTRAGGGWCLGSWAGCVCFPELQSLQMSSQVPGSEVASSVQERHSLNKF